MARSRFRRLLIRSATTAAVSAAVLPAGLLAFWPNAPAPDQPPAPDHRLAVSQPSALTTATSSAVFSAVACTGPGNCLAVGNFAVGSWVTHTLAETWSGGHWRVFQTPNPAGAASSYLFGVSCRQYGDCVTVGSSIGKSGGWRALAETWNGTSWRLTPPVFPAGAQSSNLYDVSCALPASCLAVGSYADRQGQVRPLAESLTGGTWKLLAPPSPQGQVTASLNGLSCAGSSCLAVGNQQTSSGRVSVLAEIWDDGTWQLAAPPGLAGAAPAVGQDASCGGPGACVVVGYAHRQNASAPLPLADLLASGRWRVAGSLSPAGALLSGVSCPTQTWCTAVGNGYGAKQPGPVADNWDGTAWHMSRPPAPAGARSSFLNQVSCASRTSCLAVGGSYATGRRPLAEFWNGTRWQLLPLPPA